MNKIKLLIITIFTILICSGFLQMHFSSDTYVLWDLGYMNYPQQYFLLDGRIISAIVCFIGGILKLPLEVYIIGMNFIAIIFVALSIYETSNILNSFVKRDSQFLNWIIVLISFILILNQFTLEYLLFPESAVMCLGLYLIILAIKNLIKDPNYFKIFVLLLIATICYQGLLNIFPLLVFLIYILKQITGEKINKKMIFKDLCKLIAILIGVLSLSIITIEVGKNILGSTVDRSNNLSTLNSLFNQFNTITDYFIELFNYNINLLPHYLNYIIIVVTILFLALLKSNKKEIRNYIFFIIFILMICIAPMFAFNTGPVGRVNSPIAMLWGCSLVILLLKSLDSKFKNVTYFLIIASFILNNTYIYLNIKEHLLANEKEHEMGYTINEMILKYEQQTGNTITKFGYIYDNYPEQYITGIRHLGSLTEKKLAMPWSIYEAMNYYTNRKLERIYVDQIVDVDYDDFSTDHVLFQNDIVYLIVY